MSETRECVGWGRCCRARQRARLDEIIGGVGDADSKYGARG